MNFLYKKSGSWKFSSFFEWSTLKSSIYTNFWWKSIYFFMNRFRISFGISNNITGNARNAIRSVLVPSKHFWSPRVAPVHETRFWGTEYAELIIWRCKFIWADVLFCQIFVVLEVSLSYCIIRKPHATWVPKMEISRTFWYCKLKKSEYLFFIKLQLSSHAVF